MLEAIFGVCIIVLILKLLAFCLDLYLKREKKEPKENMLYQDMNHYLLRRNLFLEKIL